MNLSEKTLKFWNSNKNTVKRTAVRHCLDTCEVSEHPKGFNRKKKEVSMLKKY